MTQYPVIQAQCRSCKQKTNHDVLHEETHTDLSPFNHGDEDDDTPSEQHYWETIRCRGCSTFAFRRYITPFFDDEGGIWNERIFPDPEINAYRPRLFRKLPPDVYQAYQEVVTAYNQGLYLLGAMGIRMVVEGIGQDAGISGGLYQKIEGLKERRLLSESHATILHELRQQGNEAAHELYRPSRETLELFIQVLDTTLHVMYELGPLATVIQAQRAQRRNKSD